MTPAWVEDLQTVFQVLHDLAWESRLDAAQPQQVEMFAGEAV